MADLTITVANVVAGGNASIEHGVSGATITAGVVVYKEASTGLFKIADADGASLEIKTPYGIALHASLTGQPRSPSARPVPLRSAPRWLRARSITSVTVPAGSGLRRTRATIFRFWAWPRRPRFSICEFRRPE
jgi:hypothetical protein